VTGPLNLKRHPKAVPIQDVAGHPAFAEGIRLFNHGEHWHAHEALEPVWMGLEGDDKLAVQAIIMAAAMLVQYGKRIERGVANHWANVRARAEGRAPTWGVDYPGLLRQLEPYAEAAARHEWGLDPKAVQIAWSR
jgi:peptidoglycan/xylan/chitin deacetylase (PgdA/CDA1 family)